MLASLSLIFIVGLAMGAICQKLKLPRIIGMLVTGIVLGPYVLDLLDPSILSISAELRKMALIIILLKAGLSLDLKDLKKAGRSAVLLSFVPASFEIAGYVLCAPAILGITRVEAAVMGAVLGAVSPAVVIPRMVVLMEKKYGTEKAIPQMIIAGASCDDIFVIVLFTTFLSIAQGGHANVRDFVNIPVSIVLGVILGAVTGYGLYLFFETAYERKHCVRNSMKVIIVLGFSFLLSAVGGVAGRKNSHIGTTCGGRNGLCDRLSPKGNGAGGNWFCSFGGRTCLWKNCSVCRCAGNHYHGTAWGNRDGCSLSKVVGKGKLKKIFRKYFGGKCVILISDKRK